MYPLRTACIPFALMLVSAACVRSAPSSDTGVTDRATIIRTRAVDQRDADGRIVAIAVGSDSAANAMVDSINGRVRVLRVSPDKMTARVGDTLSPSSALQVTGLDAAGATIPKVIPIFGPFASNGVLRPLEDGRWVARKAGVARIGVRVMRYAERPSNDSALVRIVTVEVVK